MTWPPANPPTVGHWATIQDDECPCTAPVVLSRDPTAQYPIVEFKPVPDCPRCNGTGVAK